MNGPKARVFVALSGGVDSSVAAALLKERGFSVIGVHIKMWSDPSIPCITKEDRYDAMRVAAHLEIPFETWDFTEEYKHEVIDYMIREYAAGRTPNPDVMCNREIKFGIFLKRALEAGADYIATGHYVRKREVKSQKSKVKNTIKNLKFYAMFQGIDKDKDQSYFLWTLTQKQIKHCLFPIGNYLKAEVREMAQKFSLPTAGKKDSQGLCFMGDIDLSAFLKNYISEHNGDVRTIAGKIVGKHSGVEFFTIGQRHGLKIGGGTPYYVAQKDLAMNVLTVAEDSTNAALYRRELIAEGVNWIIGNAPDFPFQCFARIRYRQPLRQCKIYQLSNSDQLQVVFDEPQRAVSSGQSIVFYRGEKMLGGAVIR